MFDEQRLLNILAVHSLLQEEEDNNESINLFYNIVTETIVERVVYEMTRTNKKQHWRYNVSLIVQDVFDEINEAIGYPQLVAFDFEVSDEEMQIQYLPDLDENWQYESRPITKKIRFDEVIDGS